MGAFTKIADIVAPMLSTAGVPGAIIGTGANIIAQQQMRDELQRQQETALAQLQSRQNLDESVSAQNAELEKTRISAEAQSAASRRNAALRRAVARQKTLFSAQGLSGGSAEAVLLGMYNDADMDAAEQTRLDGLRTTALDQQLAAQKQKNLLESAQMAERQRLARILDGYY